MKIKPIIKVSLFLKKKKFSGSATATLPAKTTDTRNIRGMITIRAIMNKYKHNMQRITIILYNKSRMECQVFIGEKI